MFGHPARCQSLGRHTVLLMSVCPSRCQSMGRHTVLLMSICLAIQLDVKVWVDILFY